MTMYGKVMLKLREAYQRLFKEELFTMLRQNGDYSYEENHRYDI